MSILCGMNFVLPNNIALLFSKQQRERAPMRRPHLPANTNIKAFTNLRRKRQSSFTPRTAHLDGGWDVPQFVHRICCTGMCFLLQVP